MQTDAKMQLVHGYAIHHRFEKTIMLHYYKESFCLLAMLHNQLKTTDFKFCNVLLRSLLNPALPTVRKLF